MIAGADRQAALGILGQTSALVLQVPEHAARKQAFDHILLMRQAQLLKQQLAPWLLLETNEVQVDYARRTRQINENLLAIERYLFKHLPSLDEFAAQKLREQFKHDGFDDELDPLADMLSLPDHVDIISTLPTANLPTFANIVPQIELAQVPQGVRTYNLVQFALENMDPDDPSIALRLKHLQVLKPGVEDSPECWVLDEGNVGPGYQRGVRTADQPGVLRQALPGGKPGQRGPRQRFADSTYGSAISPNAGAGALDGPPASNGPIGPNLVQPRYRGAQGG